jgi:hypothetical protein
MIRISVTSKLDGIRSWSLQALETCPGSVSSGGGLVDACKGCYATTGNYRYPNVKAPRSENKEDWKRDSWVSDMVRELDKDQFSYDGLRVIFDYMEDLEDSIGEPIELDVVSICCDYYEMTPEEIIEAYSIPYDAADDDLWETVRCYLEGRTSIVGETDKTIVFAQF